MNLYQRIFEQPIRSDASSAVAVVDVAKDGRQVSYAQLKRLVDSNRSTIPIKAGEKVALVMPNSLELIVGLLATWAQGGATAPLNPAYTSSEFRELFEDLSVNTALIVPGDDNIRNVLRAASRDLNIVEVDLSQLETTSMEPPPVDKANSVALYLHTSGTTGKPKAVPLRHSNLLRGASNVAEAYALSMEDRTYLLQVLFHIHGIVAALLAPLITGGSIVIPPGGKLNASRAWFDFNDYSCTWVTGTPSILQTLLAAPCPERIPVIRFIRSCSSPLLPTVFDALRKRFGCPIIEAYAMTEASHQMCSNRLDLFSPGTVGPESGGAKICIWDGGDRAQDLGAEGEVCVAGENVFGGYEGVSPEKNTEAFWYGADERGNQAKWFRTGDRGVLSTDGHRRLTLIGRLSEMVNRGGEKISPVEVDEALMLTSEDIKEAASFSVKDEFYGQEIEAAVVLVDGSRLSEGQIQHLLEQRLAQFKVPKRIHFCEGAIPKGPTGKIQRKNLTLLYDNSNKAKAHTNTALPAKDIYRIIDESLSLQPGTSQARPNVTLLALGADSMGLASIVASVRKLTGKTIPMAELFSFPPVDRVVEMVSQADATRSSGEAETFQKPEAFSLLNISHESLQECCSEAGIKTDDLEDAFPLSAVQAAFWLRVIGEGTDHNLGWKISRYQLAETVDRERLLQALTTLERYEESLRWTFAKPADSDWVTLQTRPGVESRVHEIHANTDGEATQELERRFSSFAHHSGVRTSHMFVMSSDSGLELAFIESHVCSEAVSRNMIIENLQKLYDNEVPDSHAPYALFVQKYPAGNDSRQAREFWQNELEALWYSEKPDWNLKKRCLVHPPELSDSRLTLAGVKQSVEGPFQQLSVHVGMTLPLTVESVFALSLAIYFGQQDSAFTRGHLAYDRGMSLRAPESGFHDLRSLTLSFHPSLPLTDLAKQSLWTFMQHYKSMTELRQQNACLDVKSIPDNYAISYLWRFEDPSTTPCRLISEVKKESFEMRTYKTCLTTASRNGPNGVTFGIGFQPKWLEDQRRSGSKVELIDVCCRALRFISIRHTDLARLNFEDLRKAVMGGDC